MKREDRDKIGRKRGGGGLKKGLACYRTKCKSERITNQRIESVCERERERERERGGGKEKEKESQIMTKRKVD